MCIGGSKSKSLPPVEKAKEPVKAPTQADPLVKKAKVDARTKAAQRNGRRKSLMGGSLESKPDNQPKKSLLGT